MIPRGLGTALIVLLLFGAGVYAGRRWFPRIVVQPVDRIVEKLSPGKTITVVKKVPGPIRTVTQTVTRTEDHFVFTTLPVTLSPEELAAAEAAALRKFTLQLKIPAGQLIPCVRPTLATGGVTCGEDIRFQARILEPAAGVFVPVVIPGELAVPEKLVVEARPEATAPLEAATHLGLYPTAVFSWPQLHLASEITYRNRAGWGGTYEARASYHYDGEGVQYALLWGTAW